MGFVDGHSVYGLHVCWPRRKLGLCPAIAKTLASAKSEEISRLKQDLEESQAQIHALKSRLEAVETIVTDEEAELRREFYKLQNG